MMRDDGETEMTCSTTRESTDFFEETQNLNVGKIHQKPSLQKKVLTEIVAIVVVLVLWWFLELRHQIGQDDLFLAGSYTAFIMQGIFITRLQHLVEFCLEIWHPRLASQRKVQVYLIELIWGTAVFLALTTLIIRGYFVETDSCTVTFGGISTILEQGVCVEVEGEFVVLGEVTDLGNEDAIAFQELVQHCVAQFSWHISICFVAIGVLYMFELSFVATEMRYELQLHHVAGIMIGLMPFITPINTGALLITMLQAAFALFEQPLFIAMFYYRAVEGKWANKKRLFLIAAVQFIISKFIILVLSLVVVFKISSNLTDAVKIAWIVLLIFICIVQAFSVQSLIALYKKCRIKSQQT